MSRLFTSGGQSIGASASVLPVNIQDWFPLRLIGLISLQSKGLSKVFSNTTFKSVNSLALSFFYENELVFIFMWSYANLFKAVYQKQFGYVLIGMLFVSS